MPYALFCTKVHSASFFSRKFDWNDIFYFYCCEYILILNFVYLSSLRFLTILAYSNEKQYKNFKQICVPVHKLLLFLMNFASTHAILIYFLLNNAIILYFTRQEHGKWQKSGGAEIRIKNLSNSQSINIIFNLFWVIKYITYLTYYGDNTNNSMTFSLKISKKKLDIHKPFQQIAVRSIVDEFVL